MANILVDGFAQIFHGERATVRDANNFVYVCVFTNSDNTIRMYKGNVAGEPASFAEQTTGTPPVATGGDFKGMSMAIDSAGLITVISYFDDGAAMSPTDDIRSFGFRTSAHPTSQDEWVDKNVEVGQLVQGLATFDIGRLSVQIDASDIAHAFWLDEVNNMGSPFQIFRHSRRTGGTWDSPTTITPAANNVDYHNMGTTIGDPLSSVGADRPILIAGTGDQLDAYYGNALAATSWVEERDITGAILADVGGNNQFFGMVQTDDKKITIAFREQGTLDLMIVEHLHANAWTSWETPADVDVIEDWFQIGMTANVNFRYIYVTDITNDIHLWKDEGSGFVEETADPDLPNIGSFNKPEPKWQKYNNNSPRELDYVFSAGGATPDILYNTFQGSAQPVAGVGEAESGTIGNMIFAILIGLNLVSLING